MVAVAVAGLMRHDKKKVFMHAIAKLLNNLGVNKSEIYPELDKIAGHIFEEMDMFLKNLISVIVVSFLFYTKKA